MVKRGNVRELNKILTQKDISKNQKSKVLSSNFGRIFSTILIWIIGIIMAFGGIVMIYSNFTNFIYLILGILSILLGIGLILLNKHIQKNGKI